jgi:hypothetical protein
MESITSGKFHNQIADGRVVQRTVASRSATKNGSRAALSSAPLAGFCDTYATSIQAQN